ncbi:MAG TPA: bifunctional 3-hydroxydecanoyl-ACP dehydratase/trans-2-decenoyl-ACP isomerase [Vicinamibacterales bacterium]|nr:bifunctional 3-hydroxydecanoyl-ACP dehydratase/trans-2-decenoyl-ACP isomerase [Vicinamibacterales bacterium]HOQ59606.1 bifunctional 3-hydroxydecanoyl-ACP dehydratase/trans-2-decenoyl-ACP isomerase [Vicinamibacterales bacterium]
MTYAEFQQRASFSKEEVLACAFGTLVTDPPSEGFASLPGPPMLMVDRVVEISHRGPQGRIVAEYDVAVDAWFFQCHFRGDPVQPGCLGVDAVWQLIGLYGAVRGAKGGGRALGAKEIEFFGQIRPYNTLVRYEIDIRRYAELAGSGSAIAIGTGTVLVDGEPIYTVKDAKVGMFRDIRYTDYPLRSANSVGGRMTR